MVTITIYAYTRKEISMNIIMKDGCNVENLKIITKEINIIVNMQGKGLSIMLLYISLRQTRTWTKRTKKQKQPNTEQRNKKQTMTQTRLSNKNNYRHQSLCTISVCTTFTKKYSRGAVSISLRMN